MSFFHVSIYKFLYKIAFGMLGCLLCAGLLIWYIYALPYQSPGIVALDSYVEITSGSSARAVATRLADKGIIRSEDTFIFVLKSLGKADQVKSGTYYFDQPQTLYQIVERVTGAQYGLPGQTITLFEGEANFTYAKRLASKFEYVTESEFNRLAAPYEGFLFPDTYNIPLRSSSQEIIDIMHVNFERRTASLQDQIAASPYTLSEIITMASLIETEAGSASYETKQKVSGVLWKRIEIGMPLQADAVFSYIYQEHLPLVLFKHLEVDSPYNVYKNTGFPPGPIANPGLDSIKAALNPIDTGNLFYITGNDGKFYYSPTFSGHNANIRKYLR